MPTQTDTLRMVVVDDEQLARDELCFLVGSIGGVEIVAQAANGVEALRVFEEHTPDVVMLDVVLVSVLDVGDAPHGLADAYAAQADWDPRDAGEGYVYVVLAPERIQAWREADEIAGRTLMRGGRWLV